MTDNDKTYIREEGEEAIEFVRRVIADQPDRVDYYPDGDDAWKLVIRRNIPPLIVTRRPY